MCAKNSQKNRRARALPLLLKAYKLNRTYLGETVQFNKSISQIHPNGATYEETIGRKPLATTKFDSNSLNAGSASIDDGCSLDTMPASESRVVVSRSVNPHQPLIMHSLYLHRQLRFSLEHPSHWQIVEHEDGAVEFWYPDRERAVGMTIFQAAPHIVAQIQQAPELWQPLAQGLLQHSDSTEIKPDERLAYKNLCAKRTEANQAGQRWVVYSNGGVFCIATCVPDVEQETMGEVLDSMLRSLTIEDSKELSSDLLSRLNTVLMERLPNSNVELTDNALKIDTMAIPIDEIVATLRSSLDSFDASGIADTASDGASSLAAHAKKREAVLGQFADTLIGTLVAATAVESESWTDVQHRILPLLKPASYVREVNQRNAITSPDGSRPPAILISIPWMMELRVCFAIDDQRTFRFVSDTDIHRWNVTVEDLCGAAINNLTDLPFPRFIVRTLGDGQPKIAALEPTAGPATSFALHPDLYRHASQHVGPSVVVGVPSRDVCLMFEDRGDYNNMKHAVEIEFKNSDHRLTNQLFRISSTGIELIG